LSPGGGFGFVKLLSGREKTDGFGALSAWIPSYHWRRIKSRERTSEGVKTCSMTIPYRETGKGRKPREKSDTKRGRVDQRDLVVRQDIFLGGEHEKKLLATTVTISRGKGREEVLKREEKERIMINPGNQGG